MNGIIKKIKSNADISLFTLFITIKLFFYAITISKNILSIFPLLIPALSSVMIVASVTLLIPPPKRAKTLWLLNLIITAVIVADLNFFRYYKDILTIPVLRNGLLLGAVKSSVFSLINFTDFLYFIDLILLKVWKSKINNLTTNSIPYLKRFVSFLIVFLISFALNTTSFKVLAKQQPSLLSVMYNRLYISERLGNLNFHALDAFNYINNNVMGRNQITEEEANEIKSYFNNNASDNNVDKKYSGIAEGKNLIVIQVEALQEFLINKDINGQEVTPNLNKLINESVYFDNFFYQVAGGNTSDAEFMMNNSLYPAPAGAAYYVYSNDYLNSLPKLLKEKGYETSASHAYKESYWNRNIMYEVQGFDTFNGESSFDIDKVIGMGLSDKSFFKQSVENMNSIDSPFYSFLVTLTSHFPFYDTANYGKFDCGEFENSFLGNYIKSIHYVDSAIGELIEELKKEDIYDDSIIVIYGDHYAIPRKHQDALGKFLNIDTEDPVNWFNLQKVPMLIHFPQDEVKGINSSFTGQMDILPTLANLYNLDGTYTLGNDMFNPKNNLVIFRNSSFTDGNIYYEAQSNTYYDLKTKETLEETEELKKLKLKAIKDLQISDGILNNNLLNDFINN